MDLTIAQRADEIECQGLPPDGTDLRMLHHETVELWRQAPNWYTMTELNRRFLEGRLLCPSYDFFVEAETERFLKLLVLHDYGVITTSSCPGMEEAVTRQRQYLYFSIPTQDSSIPPGAIRNFVQALVNSPYVYAHVRFQYYSACPGIVRHQDISDLMSKGSCNNLPELGGLEWSMEGWSHDEDGYGRLCAFNWPQEQFREGAEEDWDHTNSGDIGITTSGSIFRDDENPMPASHTLDPLQIPVVARDWDYTGIGELIEQLLIDSGFTREFTAQEYRL